MSKDVFINVIIDHLKQEIIQGQTHTSFNTESMEVLKKFSDKYEDFKDDVAEVKFENNAGILEDTKNMKSDKYTVKENFEIAKIPEPKSFSLPEASKEEKWAYLKEIVLNDEVCKQHLKPEKNLVFGVGNLNAKVFFCGEAPGADEEIQAEPFVGKAGQMLTKIIGAMGLSREEVYISNIMNWRPELPTSRGNRPPTKEEMAYCLPYLKAQVDIVKPQVLVALGNTAVKGLLGEDSSRQLKNVRGKWHKYEGIDLMITYHPSYLLQYASNALKRLAWEDMMMVMEKVDLPISEKQRGYFLTE